MSSTIHRPGDNEYAPFYAGYIQQVPEGDIFEILARQSDALRRLLAALPAHQADFRPGPAEWSIKEVVGHINDVERVFAYRALRISRGDQTPLPGFEQDDYVRTAHFGDRTLLDLLEEFDLLRRANLLTFRGLSEEASLRQGTVSGSTVSARALLYMLAGHVEHHRASLQQDYLAQLA
ncbi:MAG TPA: DinB family protein [Aggregatilineaceae bacterium]|nr:DinB family protein [Aggregatilineaceae bacterium]